MGLDITAHEKLGKWVGDDHETDYGDGVDHLYPEPHFPHAYPDGLKTGYYEVSGERFSFRAGSYSGYSTWRAQLARAIGLSGPEEVWQNFADLRDRFPRFLELINHSDWEGCFVGPVVAKLADDFANHRDAILKAVDGMDDWSRQRFTEVYDDFARAFQLARNGGVVQFH